MAVECLCDTNVLAELVRRAPDPGVLAWAQEVERLTLSAITVEEIEYGLAWRPNPRVRAWFDAFLGRQCVVLPVTLEIARRAGELRGRLRARGKQRTQADMLVAATAAVHDLALVTRNTRDFTDCGLALQNPFAHDRRR